MINHIRCQLAFNIVLKRPRTDCQISRRNDLFPLLINPDVRKQVTSNLFVDEPIQWLIGIERSNHVVPISPGITDQHVSIDIRQIRVT